MTISPQRLTIYLYSAHRAVIFAIAQLSCSSMTFGELLHFRHFVQSCDVNWKEVIKRLGAAWQHCTLHSAQHRPSSTMIRSVRYYRLGESSLLLLEYSVEYLIEYSSTRQVK